MLSIGMVLVTIMCTIGHSYKWEVDMHHAIYTVMHVFEPMSTGYPRKMAVNEPLSIVQSYVRDGVYKQCMFSYLLLVQLVY